MSDLMSANLQYKFEFAKKRLHRNECTSPIRFLCYKFVLCQNGTRLPFFYEYFSITEQEAKFLVFTECCDQKKSDVDSNAEIR